MLIFAQRSNKVPVHRSFLCPTKGLFSTEGTSTGAAVCVWHVLEDLRNFHVVSAFTSNASQDMILVARSESQNALQEKIGHEHGGLVHKH